MMSARQIFGMLFDPRGRADRLEMLVAAGVVVSVELASSLVFTEESVAMLGAKGLALWIGATATCKRLRDLGLNAWWMAGGLAALCIWTAFLAFGFLIFLGPAELAPGSFGLLVFLGLVMMPAVGSALWLHLAVGESLEPSEPSVAVQASPEMTRTAVG